MDEKKEKSISRTRETIAAFELALEALKQDPGEMGHIYSPLINTQLKGLKRTVECVEKGLPFFASQYTNPVEILNAMDIHWYFFVEQLNSGNMGNPHLMEDIEAADQMAVPTDCCTYLRVPLYYQVAGLLPIPTAYLALSEPCDAVTGLLAPFINHPDWRNVPVFVPDPPYHDDDRSIDYYAGELRRMIEFITEHTGKTLDMDRLKESVEETNKGYALWMEYNEIRRSTPTPHDYILPMSCYYQVNSIDGGDPDITQWYKNMVADAEMRVRENRPVIPNQKIRLFWYDIQPLYASEIFPWLQEEFGAVIAMDMVSYCPYELIDTSTEDSLFRGLARRSFHGPMIHQARGLADNVIFDVTRIIKDYNVDCVIYPGHMGHKDMAAVSGLMREVCRDFDVAFLSIGLDVVDRRYTTIDEIKDKISQFFNAMGLG